MRPTLTIIVLLAPYLASTAAPPPSHHEFQDPPPRQHSNDGRLICEPFGSCERCPEAALHQPFCQPFGNRRLLHCRNAASPDSDAKGESLAWTACGRIISKERADFFEFVACNAGFAVLSLLVLLARSRRLAYLQARTLAARIGLTRSPGG